MGLGSLFGGFAGLVGMGAESVQNSKNNRFNSQEAEKNRKWQEQMYERQVQDNLNFWDMQNAYNDPSQQVARLKAAGINPSLALSNISTGQASSINGGSAGSGAQGSAVPTSLSGGFANMANASNALSTGIKQRENMDMDALLKQIDARTRHQDNLSRIVNTTSGSVQNQASAALSRSLKESEDMLRGHKKQLIDSQVRKTNLEGLAQAINNEYLPQEKQTQLLINLEQISNLRKQGVLTDHEVALRVKQIIHEEAKGFGQKLQNQLFEQTMPYVLDKTKIDVFNTLTPMGIIGAGVNDLRYLLKDGYEYLKERYNASRK